MQKLTIGERQSRARKVSKRELRAVARKIKWSPELYALAKQISEKVNK